MAVTAGDRTVTIDEVRQAVSNRLEETEGPKEWYQVWVGIIPLTEYVRDNASQLDIFADCEIKFSEGSFYKDIRLSTGHIFRMISFKLLASTVNMDVSIYLNAMTNNAVAFYYENRKTQTLTRLRLEEFDSMLEQLSDEYYNDEHSLEGDEYHTMLYCVVDGRIINRLYGKMWFYAGNGTLEAHVMRAKGSSFEKTNEYPKQDVWWPVHGKWFAEVPNWLHIPTKEEIDYVEDGTTQFWEILHNRQRIGH